MKFPFHAHSRMPGYLLVLLLSTYTQYTLADETGKPDGSAYPTLDRVEFVLGCMDVKGGQNYTNLYGCVCIMDRIVAEVPYEAYLDATTLQVMMQTPGERGGAFRDAPGARQLTRGYDEVVAEAERKCFVK